MIETHAHIYDSEFDADLAEVISRAKNKGINEIWMPNCNAESIPRMYHVEQKFPSLCKPMMGLHPSYVQENYVEELNQIKFELGQRSFIMIGEIGIDYYWDLTFVKEQETVFTQHLKWAKEYNLPICIHSRNSKDQSLNAIQKCCDLIEDFSWRGLKGIFHCFSGNLDDAKRVIDLGFLLGIGGVVTFKNGGIDKFLSEIPLDKIVLETDAPYLAPVPNRGKRNEPSYLDLVVEKLSKVYGVSADVIISQTTKNAKSLISE